EGTGSDDALEVLALRDQPVAERHAQGVPLAGQTAVPLAAVSGVVDADAGAVAELLAGVASRVDFRGVDDQRAGDRAGNEDETGQPLNPELGPQKRPSSDTPGPFRVISSLGTTAVSMTVGRSTNV